MKQIKEVPTVSSNQFEIYGKWILDTSTPEGRKILKEFESVPTVSSNIKKALQSIRAKTILIPCIQDLYFRPEDNIFEVKHIPNY